MEGRYTWIGASVFSGLFFGLLGWLIQAAPLAIFLMFVAGAVITGGIGYKLDSLKQDRNDITERHNDRAKGLEPHRPKVDAQGNRQVRRHYADKFGFRHIQPSPGNIHVPHRAYDTHGMQDGLKGDAFVETGENHVMDARSRNRNGADD